MGTRKSQQTTGSTKFLNELIRYHVEEFVRLEQRKTVLHAHSQDRERQGPRNGPNRAGLRDMIGKLHDQLDAVLVMIDEEEITTCK